MVSGREADPLMFGAVSIAILMLAIDFGAVGILPTLLKLSPSVREIDKNEIIIHGSASSVHYKTENETKNKWLDFWINNRAGIKLILTREFLYIQNRILTYAVKLPVSEMKRFTMVRKDLMGCVFGDRIEIELKSGGELRLRSEEIDAWSSALQCLGIPQEN